MYLLLKNGYDVELFNEALKNTFAHRDSILDKKYIEETIEIIRNSSIQKELFERYCKNNRFVKDITFNDVMNAVIKVFDSIEF